jgi:hypothetical protein
MSNPGVPVVRQAVAVILRRLEHLPQTDKTECLRGWAEDCVRGTEAGAAAPSYQERDAIMKSVLALHLEVTKLERAATAACAAF